MNLGSLYIEEARIAEERSSDRRASCSIRRWTSWKQAVKLNPRSALGYFLLGQANYRSRFLEEAEAAFKKAHELDPVLDRCPSDAREHLRQAVEKWDDVLENLDAYLKENPKAPDRACVEQMRDRIGKSMQHSDEQ